jgi:hypothetical protein
MGTSRGRRLVQVPFEEKMSELERLARKLKRDRVFWNLASTDQKLIELRVAYKELHEEWKRLKAQKVLF